MDELTKRTSSRKWRAGIRSALFSLLMLCMVFPAFARSGNVTINVSGAPLQTVLKKIEQQTDYRFFYTKDAVDVNSKVNLNVKDEPLTSVLDKLFDSRKISYQIDKKQIVLTKVAGVTTKSGKSPEKKKGEIVKVSGYVYDAAHEPLIGVTVMDKVSKKGVATDIEGKYEIEVPLGSNLSYTYVGYDPVSKKISGEGSLDVTMKESSNVLNEVVVTGYGATTRKNLTTSITTVKTDGIQKAASSNVNSMLLGRAAGVQANVSSPQPGGGINISIRGGGNPIYVVDGVVMPNGSLEGGTGDIALPGSINRSGLQGLNPSDIESMEILKDAAAAIYGIGAADGVILITTKKGKMGKPSITYEGSYSWQKPEKYFKLLHGNEYMNVVNVFSKENYLYNHNQYPYGNTAYDGKWQPLFSQQQIANAIDTDWRSMILRTGAITNHNLAINGGTEWVKYYLGLNYYKEDATVKNSDMERFSLRTNIQTKLTNFMRFTTVVNLNKNNYTNSTNGDAVGNMGDQCAGSLYAAETYPTYLPVMNENGEYTQFNRTPNPVSSLLISDKSEQSAYYVNFALDIDIIKDMLSVRGVYGYNHETSSRDSYIPSNVYFSLQKKSRGNIESSSRSNGTLEAFVNFQKRFGEIVDFSAMLGMGLYRSHGKGQYISYENAIDKLNSESVQKADGPFFPGSYKWGDEKRSQFGRVTGDFLNRYVIQASIRRDGTDKFFPGKKYSWFPSVSLAWKIQNEAFMRDITWINMLKLRASYGETGSDNLGSTLYGVIGTTRENVMFNNNSTSYIPFVLQGANYPDVSWQKTVMKNIGLDFSVLNDRLSGTIDVFRNDVTRMLGYSPTEILGMHGTRPINGAHFKRYGVDLSLNSTNIQTKDFTWTTVLTLSHYKAKWLERMPNQDFAQYAMREGEPMNVMYYYKTDGLININRDNIPDSQRSLGANACQPGVPIIVDKNNDGKIDIDDIYMDDMLPKVYYGLGNSFKYKGFDLELFFYGNLGVRKFNQSYGKVNLEGTFEAGNMSQDVFHVWNSQTNSGNAKFPGVASRYLTLPGNCGTDIGYENASFLRVRNITLGYTFGPEFFKWTKGYVKNIRLYVDFQNPFTITRFKDSDPEINMSGVGLNGGQFPSNRAYTMGIKLQF